MKITVFLYGGLSGKIHPGKNREELVFRKKNPAVSEVIRKLGYSQKEAEHITVAVNDRVKTRETKLKDRDIVILSLPIGGG